MALFDQYSVHRVDDEDGSIRLNMYLGGLVDDSATPDKTYVRDPKKVWLNEDGSKVTKEEAQALVDWIGPNLADGTLVVEEPVPHPEPVIPADSPDFVTPEPSQTTEPTEPSSV